MSYLNKFFKLNQEQIIKFLTECKIANFDETDKECWIKNSIQIWHSKDEISIYSKRKNDLAIYFHFSDFNVKVYNLLDNGLIVHFGNKKQLDSYLTNYVLGMKKMFGKPYVRDYLKNKVSNKPTILTADELNELEKFEKAINQ